MSKEQKPENPLARYLKKHGLTLAQFSRRLYYDHGWAVRDGTIGHWASSRHMPGIDSQRKLRDCTGGEIAVDDWAIHFDRDPRHVFQAHRFTPGPMHVRPGAGGKKNSG